MVSKEIGQLVAMRQRTVGSETVLLVSSRRIVQELSKPVPAAAVRAAAPVPSSFLRCMSSLFLKSTGDIQSLVQLISQLELVVGVRVAYVSDLLHERRL